MMAIRPHSAPRGGRLAVCPHCWNVNPYAQRLCDRCGADMATALQESGGLRRTAPVQSPVPVGAAGRLRPVQRIGIAVLLALLALAHLAAVFAAEPAGRAPSAAQAR